MEKTLDAWRVWGHKEKGMTDNERGLDEITDLDEHEFGKIRELVMDRQRVGHD